MRARRYQPPHGGALCSPRYWALGKGAALEPQAAQRVSGGSQHLPPPSVSFLQKHRLRLVATDGAFSMDGDIAPLKDICRLASQYGALVFVDDCHATGFLGATGRWEHTALEALGWTSQGGWETGRPAPKPNP